MNKLIAVLLFSLMIGFTGSTYSADGKPPSPQKECVLQGELHYKIAQARSTTTPSQLASDMWGIYEARKITAIQLAATLATIIDIYSSPLSAQEIRDSVYKECMTTIGKNEV